MIRKSGLKGEMAVRRVLVVEKAGEYRQTLTEILEKQCEVCAEAQADMVLRRLAQWQPDGVILDLTLPGVDGIGLLQKIACCSPRPAVLVTTGYLNEYLEAAFQKLHVGYVMHKPCSAEAVAQRMHGLLDFYTVSGEKAACGTTQVRKLLMELGISGKLQGWSFLCTAVELKLEQPEQLVTKQLYPAVGQICGADRTVVERCIRTAIAGAWRTGDVRVWSRFFPPDASGKIPRPTNKAFISRLCQALDHGI